MSEQVRPRESLLVSRVLLVDDHPVTRHGLADIVERSDGLCVCGEAGTAEDALRQVSEKKPDLVLLDLTLPDGNGLEIIPQMRENAPSTKILVLSMHSERDCAGHVMRAGGHGYLTKDSGVDRIRNAIRSVLSGQIHITEEGLQSICCAPGQLAVPHGQERWACLSERETQVAMLIGRGFPVDEIAVSLEISPWTVETHRAHIKKKLGFSNAVEVRKWASQWARDHQAPGACQLSDMSL